MTQELRLFFIALQFLTRVPVPRRLGFEPAWLQACLRHFPLVGACVGAWAAAIFWFALLLWPPLVASTVSLVATVWLTGAFHEDGLADTCDALGGAVSRERALAIMKDSRIGSYGAVALVLALVLKVTAVAGLASAAQTDGLAWAAMALIWSHAVSRAAPVWLVWRLPYAAMPSTRRPSHWPRGRAAAAWASRWSGSGSPAVQPCGSRSGPRLLPGRLRFGWPCLPWRHAHRPRCVARAGCTTGWAVSPATRWAPRSRSSNWSAC
nr:Cobalamin synthase [Methylibium sp. T29-B]